MDERVGRERGKVWVKESPFTLIATPGGLVNINKSDTLEKFLEGNPVSVSKLRSLFKLSGQFSNMKSNWLNELNRSFTFAYDPVKFRQSPPTGSFKSTDTTDVPFIFWLRSGRGLGKTAKPFSPPLAHNLWSIVQG